MVTDQDTRPRTFLIVADDSPEMVIALRYAAWRARNVQGRVAMLYVIEPREIYPWRAVEKIMDAEAITAGKAVLRKHEDYLTQMTGHKPALYIRRGKRRETLLELIDKQPGISILVLAARTGPEGPGPLVSYLTSAKGIGKLKIPLVLVPDTYTLDADNLLI